jgi:hypothetical protein
MIIMPNPWPHREEIINSGSLSSLQNKPESGRKLLRGDYQKVSQPRDHSGTGFLVSKDKRHGFTYDNIARNVREDNLSSSSITPSLNLVEDYEYLDGTSGRTENQKCRQHRLHLLRQCAGYFRKQRRASLWHDHLSGNILSGARGTDTGGCEGLEQAPTASRPSNPIH